MEGLQELAVKRGRNDDGRKVNRTNLIREAVDNLLEKEREGIRLAKIPPIIAAKLEILVEHGFASSEQALLEHALLTLVRDSGSLVDLEAFEKSVLRAHVGTAVERSSTRRSPD